MVSDADELEWYVPAAILPDDLQRSLDVIEQYIKEPLDLEGKKALDLITKRRKAKTSRKTRRSRRGAEEGSDGEVGVLPSDVDDSNSDEPRARAKRKKKEKERMIYKSAEMILDSDAELEDDEAFFAKEREMRRKTEAAAGEAVPSNMASTGTKKRKKKAKDGPAKKFKTFIDPETGAAEAEVEGGDEEPPMDSDADDTPPAKRATRPRPGAKARTSATASVSSGTSPPPSSSGGEDDDESDNTDSPSERPKKRPRPRTRRRYGGGATAEDPALVASASSPARTSSPAPSEKGSAMLEVGADDEDDPIVAIPSRAIRKRLILAESDDDE